MRPLTTTVLCLILFVGCGGSKSPTAVTPAAVATAAPQPTPTPNPFAAACGAPLPPIADMYGYGIKVQLEPTRTKKILNANPYVKNQQYCQDVGTPAPFCQTRLETDPARVACDHYISGMSDEGGPGPNWYQVINNKKYRCGGGKLPGDAPGCSLKEENQYLLDVHLPGKYIACGGAGSNESCGVCILEEYNFEAPANNGGNARPGLCQLD